MNNITFPQESIRNTTLKLKRHGLSPNHLLKFCTSHLTFELSTRLCTLMPYKVTIPTCLLQANGDVVICALCGTGAKYFSALKHFHTRAEIVDCRPLVRVSALLRLSSVRVVLYCMPDLLTTEKNKHEG